MNAVNSRSWKGGMLLFMSFAATLSLTVMLSAVSSVTAAECGDSDNNGVLQIQDILLDIEYIFIGGAPPPDFDIADFDGHQGLSIGDVYEQWNCFFTCIGGSNGTCPPTQPALAPVPDPAVELRYQNIAPPGLTTLDLELKLVGAPTYGAFTAPLIITIDGTPALIDSVTIPAPGSVFTTLNNDIGISSIDGSGVVRLGLIASSLRSGAVDVPAIIHLSIPPSATGSTIELNWTTLSPAQAPVADSSVFPLFYRGLGDDGFVPTLTGVTGACCLIAGDANFDGSFNIADVTFLIARIFAGGAAPECPQSADADAGGDVNIADVTYDIANIFSGGPNPICGP